MPLGPAQGKTRTLEAALQNRVRWPTEYTCNSAVPPRFWHCRYFATCNLDILELLSVLAVAGLVLHGLNKQHRQRRTALLARHLQPFQIERLMQRLTEAYMRALAEADPQRQAELWQAQHEVERQLAQQFQDFVRGFAQLPAPEARTLKLACPGLERVWPQASFDTRRMLQVHAEGIARAVANGDGLDPKARAHRLLAEMFLMQHSCHWFCRSRAMASARMWAQHRTQHAQALQAVSPLTREAYLALVQGPALGGTAQP